MSFDRRSPVPRRAQDRLNDHAAIDHLADELLPALVAKLGASGLGELEIREGTWRVRLRMPADGQAAAGRRQVAGRGGSRAGDGPHGERATAAPRVPEAATAVGPSRVMATSPAVGYFRPRGDLRAGTKVRAGDRIGSVDVLGIGQDLVAPGDGLIGATLVAAGEPVEYGQAIIVLEQLAQPRPPAAGPAAAEGQVAAEGQAAADGTIDDTGAAARVAEADAGPEAAPAGDAASALPADGTADAAFDTASDDMDADTAVDDMDLEAAADGLDAGASEASTDPDVAPPTGIG